MMTEFILWPKTHRLNRVMVFVLILAAVFLLLASIALFEQARVLPLATQVDNTKTKTADPDVPLTFLLSPRTAYAAESSGEGDRTADVVYGQDDFISNAASMTISSTTLFTPNDLFVHQNTGQIFIADTVHNRVLGWHSVDDYEIGDPADIVLGQTDFETAAAPSPPTAASMNQPMGITMGFDGVLYVSDTGNNRVLVFIPWNICDFYEYYDDIWCKESDGYEFSDNFMPNFTSSMEADYVIGQMNETTGVAQGTDINTLNSPMGLVTDRNDNLVIADHGNNRVVIYEWPLTTGSDASWILGQPETGTGNEFFTTNDAPNPPTAISMNGPSGVAIGTVADELYVADTNNNRILVFNEMPLDQTADEVIGQPDFVSNIANNGGVLSTTLNSPTGLKMDAGNRLFVADTANHRILAFDRVNGDGTADQVFGQPDYTSNTANNGGISASTLYSPTGVATDAFFMDMFVADSGNNRVLHYYQPLDNPTPVIEELDPGTVFAGEEGFILDIWGSGIISETMISINGIERDRDDFFFGVIAVELTAEDVMTAGQITVTLTNPAPGGGSDDFVLDVIEIAEGDDAGDSVLGQNGFTTDFGPFAKLSASTLYGPSSVTVDPATGRVFVADSENGRVLSWSSQNAWENGAAADLVIGEPDFQTWSAEINISNSLAVPVGLTLDRNGNLYVADGFWNIIQIYTAPFSNGMAPSLTITNLFNPLDIAVNDAGDLYVADTFNHRVLVYYDVLASDDTTPDVVFGQDNFVDNAENKGGAPTADTLSYPSGLVLDADGMLYVSDSNNNRVLAYLPAPVDGDTTADVVFGQNGSFTDNGENNGGISANSLDYPYGLALDMFGALYVADADNNRVLVYSDPLVSQTADEVFGQNGSFGAGRANQSVSRNQGTLSNPLDIGVTAQGDIYIADNGNNRVIGFRTSSTQIYLPMLQR